MSTRITDTTEKPAGPTTITEHEMLQKAEHDEDWRPRQVTQNRGNASGNAFANRLGVPNCLLAQPVLRREFSLHHGFK